MIEYRVKVPSGGIWKPMNFRMTIDQIRTDEFDHRIDGIIYSGELTGEFLRVLKAELLWRMIQQ